MRRLAPKITPDGLSLLNIGCGWKMHWSWTNVDFSPYARLARHPRVAGLLAAARILSPLRQERLGKVDPEIVCWDLRRGLPYEDESFDAVYHSHFLEHVTRDAAPALIRECLRVLKPAGVLRVVVPDWELLTHVYLEALAAWDRGEPDANDRHHRAMYDLIDQMVRRDATGASASGLFGRLENQLRGGAEGIGELHRWMYDRQSLGALLAANGFRDVRKETAQTSQITSWERYALDLDERGAVYKPESLYLEAVK